MQPFPQPSDATHKIWSRLANCLQRYSSLKVWTTTDDDGRRRTTTDDGRRTDDGPLVYYKLTLWAFGSGELKTERQSPDCPADDLLSTNRRLTVAWYLPSFARCLPDRGRLRATVPTYISSRLHNTHHILWHGGNASVVVDGGKRLIVQLLEPYYLYWMRWHPRVIWSVDGWGTIEKTRSNVHIDFWFFISMLTIRPSYALNRKIKRAKIP